MSSISSYLSGENRLNSEMARAIAAKGSTTTIRAAKVAAVPTARSAMVVSMAL